jgi:hypothetical protein
VRLALLASVALLAPALAGCGGCQDRRCGDVGSRAVVTPPAVAPPDLDRCREQGAERGRAEYRRRFRRARRAAFRHAYKRAYRAAYWRAYRGRLERAGVATGWEEPLLAGTGVTPGRSGASTCATARHGGFATAASGARANGRRAGRRDGAARGAANGAAAGEQAGKVAARRLVPKPILLQAEEMTGRGELRTRPGGDTRLMTGGTATLRFRTSSRPARYAVFARYSNDNLNDRPVEQVGFELDGTTVGGFLPRDTGDGGLGWDKLLETGALGTATLTARRHALRLHVSGGDGYGVEIDWVRLVPGGSR